MDREDDLGWGRLGGWGWSHADPATPQGLLSRKLQHHLGDTCFFTKSVEQVCSVSLPSSKIVPILDKWAFVWFMPLQLQHSLIIGQFMEKNAMLLLLMEVACYLFMFFPSLGFIFPIKFGSVIQMPCCCGCDCAFWTRIWALVQQPHITQGLACSTCTHTSFWNLFCLMFACRSPHSGMRRDPLCCNYRPISFCSQLQSHASVPLVIVGKPGPPWPLWHWGLCICETKKGNNYLLWLAIMIGQRAT